MKKRLRILSVVAAVISAGLVYLFLHVDFIPNSSSTERESIDHLLKILFSIASVFFTVIIVVFIDTLLFFWRRRGDDTDGPSWKGYGTLELSWTLLPLLIVITWVLTGGLYSLI